MTGWQVGDSWHGRQSAVYNFVTTYLKSVASAFVEPTSENVLSLDLLMFSFVLSISDRYFSKIDETTKPVP